LEHSDVAPLGLSGFSPAHFYKDTAPLALSEWLTTKSDGIRKFQAPMQQSLQRERTIANRSLGRERHAIPTRRTADQ
jgi:hypothetical protein